ncbi:MAG: hypothetical protein RIS29_3101 [Bacteroidota bacterium]|jgi:hypothetical protein
MKKALIYPLLLLSLLSCKKEKAEEWFVITDEASSIDSLSYIDDHGIANGYMSLRHQDKNHIVKKLKRTIGPNKNWYYDLQIILDSTDKVYIYQTELKKKLPLNDCWDDNIRDFRLFPPYSNYIGLRPEHLLAFDSKYFVDFLKANNDIFGFDINDRDSAFMAVIATTTDTIKNPVLYQLCDLIKGSKHKRFLIRKTSEEENVVLYHKRRHIPFHPDKWRWSTHFLDGRHRPFTSSYDSLEHNTAVVFKAAPGIKRQIKKVRHIQ